MSVKRAQSGGRMLRVFETIAAAQPLGVSELSRRLGADKSAVQRDLMTLADAGWIRPVLSGKWELTSHILTLARTPHSNNGLRQRVRPILESLRSKTGETAYLTVPDGAHFVVIDAVESPQVLRIVPPIGLVVPVHGSATARAMLPYMTAPEQTRLLGAEADTSLLKQFEATRKTGYAVNNGDIIDGAVAIASALLDEEQRLYGTIVLTGPSERFSPERCEELGLQLVAAARSLAI